MMNERIDLLRVVSNRLVWSLTALVAVGITGALVSYHQFNDLIPTR